MTNRWLVGAGAVVLTVAGSFAAQAADLPTRKEAPAPVLIPPPVHLDRVLYRSQRWRHLGLGQCVVDAFRQRLPCPRKRVAWRQFRRWADRIHRRRSGRIQLADRLVRT